MTAEETIEKRLEKLAQAISPDETLIENIMSRIDAKPIGESERIKKLSTKIIARRFIMNRFTKLAAAAVIIIAAMIGINYFGGSIGGTSAVYAAAIKALQNVNTVHVTGWTTNVLPMHTTVLDEPLDNSKHYPIDIWEWFTENDEYRIYDRQGPITVWDDGDRRYEYQAHKDTLYIDKPTPPRLLSTKFQSMTDNLESLKKRGIKMTDLGTRLIGNRQAYGLRVERDNTRKDIWLDSQTNLMSESNSYIFEEGQWRQRRHGVFTYNQNIPVDIRAYVPPETAKKEYSWHIAPRFEKWHLHLRKIAAYYQQNPLPETMELLPRESDEEIQAYLPGRLPDITNTTRLWVLPIQSSLGDFLRREFQSRGSLRIPEDLQEIKLNHDLITSNKFTQHQRADFVLNTLGLEIIDITEDRKVWVAHYDGRPLKPWRQVKAPVAKPPRSPLRPGMDSTSSPHSIQNLFDSFAYLQDLDLNADKIIIIDQTGLPSEPKEGQSRESIAVSSASPFWGGEESIEIAKKWFAEQFGVTFSEEIRPMTIYVVRRRQ